MEDYKKMYEDAQKQIIELSKKLEAKSYEIALNKAKKLYSDYKNELEGIKDKSSVAALTLSGGITALEMQFPELVESKDEIIRRELIRDIEIAMPIETAQKYIDWIEKLCKQKPADEVSLNFKRGDILYEQKTMSILLVYERNGSWLMTFCDYWMLKEKLHIEFPYEKYGFVQEMSLVPATKEQRNLLFQKIKEAGYEWDAEKKELKKVEPKFKVGDIIRHKEQGFTCKIIAIDTATAEYGVSECSGTHLPFDSQDAYELVEQNSAWSEEDEKIINNIAAYLNCYGNYIVESNEEKAKDVYKSADWIKSLQNRVQLQLLPQQEWSEEDEYLLDETIKHLEILIRITKKQGSAYSHEIQYYQRDIDWLNSLRPQNTWKPSESDIRILEQVIDGIANPISYSATLHVILEHLKNLKKQ